MRNRTAKNVKWYEPNSECQYVEYTLSRVKQIKFSHACYNCVFFISLLKKKNLSCTWCIFFESDESSPSPLHSPNQHLKYSNTWHIFIIRAVSTAEKHLSVFLARVTVDFFTPPWSSVFSSCRLPLLCWTTAPLPGDPQPLQELLWHLWEANNSVLGLEDFQKFRQILNLKVCAESPHTCPQSEQE